MSKATTKSDIPELPPRARRILRSRSLRGHQLGTTSACAENTRKQRDYRICIGNYLRVRGEYAVRGNPGSFRWELPPRARRIRSIMRNFLGFIGTTSACAENTRKAERSSAKYWNYLRVRGEYNAAWIVLLPIMELPPRARRILGGGDDFRLSGGTTSACAENTFRGGSFGDFLGNYLRVRGEYGKTTLMIVLGLELPPRARRIPVHHPPRPRHHGTTSACAENTPGLP